MAWAGRGPSALTGGWQQQGVSQGDGPTEVRIVKQLQGCGEGGSTVTTGSRGPPSMARGCRVAMAWPTSLLGESKQAYRAEHRGTRGMGPGVHRGQHPRLPSPTPTSLCTGPVSSWHHSVQALGVFPLLLGGKRLFSSLCQAPCDRNQQDLLAQPPRLHPSLPTSAH